MIISTLAEIVHFNGESSTAFVLLMGLSLLNTA